MEFVGEIQLMLIDSSVKESTERVFRLEPFTRRERISAAPQRRSPGGNGAGPGAVSAAPANVNGDARCVGGTRAVRGADQQPAEVHWCQTVHCRLVKL